MHSAGTAEPHGELSVQMSETPAVRHTETPSSGEGALGIMYVFSRSVRLTRVQPGRAMLKQWLQKISFRDYGFDYKDY